MAGLINLRLLTDFFNKIGPLRQSRLARHLVACGEQQTSIRTCAERRGSV
jgi:hypothetical protein